MREITRSLAFFAMVFAFSFTCCGVENGNIIKNPRFEKGIEDWRGISPKTKDFVSISFGKEDGIPGKFLRFECQKAVFFYQNLHGLQVGEKYIFTGSLKADLKDTMI